MDFKTHFGKLGADQNWIGVYLDFVASAKSPVGRSHRHHILPRAMFPEFESFKDHSWNCKRLTPSDHFVAHYYLYRALPQHPVAYLSFLKMASVERLSILIQNNYDESLVREMSLAYERIRSGSASIEGWFHVYKGKLHTVISAEELDSRLAVGWIQTAPHRQWVRKGQECHRVPIEEVQSYLDQGFVLGKPPCHTNEFKTAVGKRTKEWHKTEQGKPDAYSYLPHGDQHHRKGGCPKEVADRISKTLDGRKLSEEHAAKVRVAAKGKHWKWSVEARRARSESMKGKRPAMSFTGHHTETTRQMMSASHKARNASETGNFSI